jgi:hypothetical protein
MKTIFEINMNKNDCNYTRWHVFLFGIFSLMVLGWGSVAQAAGVTLETDKAVYVNGETVVLSWYIPNITVTNCVIDGPGLTLPIDTTVTPATGSYDYVPPDDATVEFKLTCEQLTVATPPPPVVPVISITVDGGTTKYLEASLGRVSSVKVNWSATNANRCTGMRIQPGSTGIYQPITDTSVDYTNYEGTSGSVVFDGDPRSITESVRLGIRCYNDTESTTAWLSIPLTVLNPPPAPPSPTAAIWTPEPTPEATIDLISGKAKKVINWGSNNADRCVYGAWIDGVSQYVSHGNPATFTGGIENWGFFSFSLSGSRTVAMATTTTFGVLCYREPRVYGSVSYPTEWTDWQYLEVPVVYPGGSPEDWVRTPANGVPEVTLTATATPNPTYKSSVSGKAYTKVSVTAAYADNCKLRAYADLDNDGTYTDGYTLTGWTDTSGNVTGNGSFSREIWELRQSTRLNIYCERPFDMLYGDADERDYGSESYNIIIDVLDSPGPPPEIETFVYANVVNLDADTLWSKRTSTAGFNQVVTTGTFKSIRHGGIDTSLPGDSYAKIEFPFEHPYDLGDSYDIWFWFCDESDGESTFTVSVNGTEVGSVTSNWQYRKSNVCTNSTARRALIAEDITIEDGDSITIECTSPYNDGELCSFHRIQFGAGNDSNVVARMDPYTERAVVPMGWVGVGADSCSFQRAYPSGAASFDWSASTAVDPTENVTLATTTRFVVRCDRSVDGASDTGQTVVNVPFDSIYSAVSAFSTGECIDDGTFGTYGQLIDVPIGYILGPQPEYFCVPGVDLAMGATAASASGASEDNVNGTYDDLSLQMIIANTMYNGVGAALPANSDVSYKAYLSVMSPVALAFGVSTIESSVGYFNDSLAAPVSATAPTQSSVLVDRVDDVPFGTHTVCGRVNLDGSDIFPESNVDTTNNVNCTSFTLPVPPPPMNLSISKDLIRRDREGVDINWEVDVTYELQCTVRGPGGIDESFNTLVTGRSYADSKTTSPLSSTSEFLLQCEEPITGTVFTERARVEVVPDFEER